MTNLIMVQNIGLSARRALRNGGNRRFPLYFLKNRRYPPRFFGKTGILQGFDEVLRFVIFREYFLGRGFG
jgi:hypothetical protein